jgi:capsular polysaccharide export protein
LTSRLPLADFWNRPQAPDAEIFRKFRSYVIDKTQVNGCFYNKQGMELAVAGSLQKILGREAVSSQTEAFDAS